LDLCDRLDHAYRARTENAHLPTTGCCSAAEVLLAPYLVGLGKPADELGVDVGGRREPEGVHHVAGRQLPGLQKPRASCMPGQDKVPTEPVAARGKGREAHPHLQRDTGLLRQHLHRAEGRDRRQHLVKGRPDVPVRVSEMPVQITGPSAGVDLVPVREAAPASGAVPHRWRRSIIGDRGNASPRQDTKARSCRRGRGWPSAGLGAPAARRVP
jgi:hypothetical protein